MFQPYEIIQIVNDINLRWRDDVKGLRIANKLLKNPYDKFLQDRFQKRFQKKIRNFMNSQDAFFGNLSYPGTLPAFTRGRIPLCILPTREWLSVEAKSLTRNMLVVGSSGGGKTNFLKGTIRALLEAGATSICFDKKGRCELADCRILLGSNLPIHIWRWEELRLAPLLPVRGISINYWANLIVSLLASQWSLIASTTLLMEIVHEMYRQNDPWTWDKLIGKAVSFKCESHRSEAYKDVIVRNLKSVFYAFGEVLNAAESNIIETMTQEQGCHIITTDGLLPEHASLLSSLFIIRDYEYRRIHEEAQSKLTCYILDDSMALVR